MHRLAGGFNTVSIPEEEPLCRRTVRCGLKCRWNIKSIWDGWTDFYTFYSFTGKRHPMNPSNGYQLSAVRRASQPIFRQRGHEVLILQAFVIKPELNFGQTSLTLKLSPSSFPVHASSRLFRMLSHRLPSSNFHNSRSTRCANDLTAE